MGEQVVAPPSMPVAHAPAVEVPVWAAPEVATIPDSSREAAIAEVLRAALAQGHSDEALAGILRRVLDGASARDALETPLPEVTRAASPTADAPLAEVAVPEVAVPELVFPEPALPGPAVTPPASTAPASTGPAPTPAPVDLHPRTEPFDGPVALPDQPPSPVAAAEPSPHPLPPVDIWGTPPSASSLWGEPLGTVEAEVEVEVPDAPIWAEVLLGEPVEDTEALTEAAPETPAEPEIEPEPEVEVEPEIELAAEIEPEAEMEREPEAEPDLEPEAEVADEEHAQAVPAAEEVLLPLARTASDPAPHGLALSMASDATSVMPPLSLLPPLPSGRGRGRPPVPPSVTRPSASRAADPAGTVPARTLPGEDAPAPAAPPSLATVTRLPVLTLPGEHGSGSDAPTVEPPAPSADLFADVEPTPAVTTPSPAAPGSDGVEALVGRLTALGLPQRLLGNAFAADVDRHGVYAALTRALGLRLPPAPEAPSGPGEVLFVVGPGVETLRAARSLAASLCLDPDRVQWATRGDLAGLASEDGRMTTIDAAIARRSEAAASGTVTIVAVDAPMRTDAYWMAQMLAVWSPVAVWAVVEATRKPEDVEPWLGALSRVDALVVQDTDLSVDPAAVLHRVAAPVALLDGVRATPHRWASLLCERLEGSRG